MDTVTVGLGVCIGVVGSGVAVGVAAGGGAPTQPEIISSETIATTVT
ncbi:hypothetical protein [Candidatus Methanoperedens nitratireducens]|uniref:Uncharacterized protein n=1 Tax=Candidatus Methanoperedens nitratireducens TaxID=1392998 RepID=A0A284VS51_9EURY|nr:hypothetical protein [Candidatus Methanoperedens nitroreducens]SNQ62102.1 hypothetical protein MNV_590035 [Candidatus Methanoperedens nitroreducens]